MMQAGFTSSSIWRIFFTLGIMSAMNFWPPKPGSTVITRIISTRSIKGSTALAGVLGFTTTPAFLPLAWILSSARWIFSGVSAST